MKVQGVIKLKEKGVKFNFHSLALLLVLSDGYFSYYIERRLLQKMFYCGDLLCLPYVHKTILINKNFFWRAL